MTKKLHTLLLLAFVLAGISAWAVPDPNTCTGYPEQRIFLENQAWYRPAPGASGPDYGHVHIATCFPLYQTITGKVHFDVRLMMYRNPGTLIQYRVDVRSGSGGSQQSINKKSTSFTCDPTGMCMWWVPIDVDTALLPYAGRTSFLFLAQIREPDGNISRVSGEWQAVVSNGKVVSDYVRNFTRGAGWYTNNEYSYANFLSTVPLSPVSGVWNFNASTTTSGLPISHTYIGVDPMFHSDPNPPNLGFVLRDADGAFDGALSLDTTKLTNGQHFLVIRSDMYDPAGSNNAGELKIPFTVAN